MKAINIAIIRYPGAMRSAIEGLRELFELANSFSHEQGVEVVFNASIQDVEDVAEARYPDSIGHPLQIIILPPCLAGDYYLTEQPSLSRWLEDKHGEGAVLCSVCAGAFILAQTGLLNQRSATTHWILADSFRECFPQVLLDDNKILVNDGDLITAGGLMAWLDLGLELVAQFAQPSLMQRLGKQLVVDTGPREQRYYRCFIPKLDHGDSVVLKCQHYLQGHFNHPLTVKSLAANSHLTERTFLRRFVRATGFRPKGYLQQLRVNKACDILVNTPDTVELIALNVGYDDVSAFRKTFAKITGLTPREFRLRFKREI